MANKKVVRLVEKKGFSKVFEEAVGSIPASLDTFKTLTELDSGCKEAWLNLGACYKAVGKLDLAFDAYNRALALDSSYTLAINNSGLIDHCMGRNSAAIEKYTRAIALDSSYADAHWNYSLALFRRYFNTFNSEDFYNAKNEYEWRFRKTSPVAVPYVPGPRGVQGRCIVLCEQGLGDFIQCLRYFSSDYWYFIPPHVREFADTIGFTHNCVYTAEECLNFDSWVSMWDFMSPEISGAPYIKYSSSNLGSGVGIVWAGNSAHSNDKFRSLSADKLVVRDGISLQYGVTKSCAGNKIRYSGTKSWNETLAWLSSVRMLLTVDTSVAHAAGAMGVPTVCIVPKIDTDWRWGTVGEKTPWYDSMRIIRGDYEKAKRIIESGDLWAEV